MLLLSQCEKNRIEGIIMGLIFHAIFLISLLTRASARSGETKIKTQKDLPFEQGSLQQGIKSNEDVSVAAQHLLMSLPQRDLKLERQQLEKELGVQLLTFQDIKLDSLPATYPDKQPSAIFTINNLFRHLLSQPRDKVKANDSPDSNKRNRKKRQIDRRNGTRNIFSKVVKGSDPFQSNSAVDISGRNLDSAHAHFIDFWLQNPDSFLSDSPNGPNGGPLKIPFNPPPLFDAEPSTKSQVQMSPTEQNPFSAVKKPHIPDFISPFETDLPFPLKQALSPSFPTSTTIKPEEVTVVPERKPGNTFSLKSDTVPSYVFKSDLPPNPFSRVNETPVAKVLYTTKEQQQQQQQQRQREPQQQQPNNKKRANAKTTLASAAEIKTSRQETLTAAAATAAKTKATRAGTIRKIEQEQKQQFQRQQQRNLKQQEQHQNLKQQEQQQRKQKQQEQRQQDKQIQEQRQQQQRQQQQKQIQQGQQQQQKKHKQSQGQQQRKQKQQERRQKPKQIQEQQHQHHRQQKQIQQGQQQQQKKHKQSQGQQQRKRKQQERRQQEQRQQQQKQQAQQQEQQKQQAQQQQEQRQRERSKQPRNQKQQKLQQQQNKKPVLRQQRQHRQQKQKENQHQEQQQKSEITNGASLITTTTKQKATSRNAMTQKRPPPIEVSPKLLGVDKPPPPIEVVELRTSSKSTVNSNMTKTQMRQQIRLAHREARKQRTLERKRKKQLEAEKRMLARIKAREEQRRKRQEAREAWLKKVRQRQQERRRLREEKRRRRKEERKLAVERARVRWLERMQKRKQNKKNSVNMKQNIENKQNFQQRERHIQGRRLGTMQLKV